MAKFTVEKYTAPAAWASYLINGDATGFDYYNTPDDKAGDRDQAEADAFIASVGLGSPVDCTPDEPFFSSRPDYGMAGDCFEYSFLRPEDTNAG